jgi:hypothetical protein
VATVGQGYLLGDPYSVELNLNNIQDHFLIEFLSYHGSGKQVLQNQERQYLPFVFLMAGLIFIFYRKPFPVVYFFFGLAVIVVNTYGVWYVSQVGNRFEQFLQLFE